MENYKGSKVAPGYNSDRKVLCSFLFSRGPVTVMCLSWVRGLLLGRDLLLKGLGWALGSCTEAGVWAEPWLSTSEPMAPMGPPTEATQSWRVSDLLKPGTNEWDTDIIRSTLPQYEEMIRKIIPSSSHLRDERVWMFNASGEYSTKSGYAVAKLNNGETDTQSFNWKKSIWQVATSPKINHFMCKANSGALPVGFALEARGIATNPVCKRCGERETEVHVLLQCPFAMRVWELVPCLFKPIAQNINSVASLLTQCQRMISLPPIGLGSTQLYPWIMWLLWINRNQLVFENKLFSEKSTVLKAVRDAKAWKAAQTFVLKPSLPQYVGDPTPSPAVNSCIWSVFSDAAWDQATGNCGLEVSTTLLVISE